MDDKLSNLSRVDCSNYITRKSIHERGKMRPTCKKTLQKASTALYIAGGISLLHEAYSAVSGWYNKNQ